MRIQLIPMIVVLVALNGCNRDPDPSNLKRARSDVEAVSFEVDLGGWSSDAELLHPVPGGVHGQGPWPLVLMISGNGPHDMDVTLPFAGATYPLFGIIARELASQGCAVVRYHKRFVSGPNQYDRKFLA